MPGGNIRFTATSEGSTDRDPRSSLRPAPVGARNRGNPRGARGQPGHPATRPGAPEPRSDRDQRDRPDVRDGDGAGGEARAERRAAARTRRSPRSRPSIPWQCPRSAGRTNSRNRRRPNAGSTLLVPPGPGRARGGASRRDAHRIRGADASRPRVDPRLQRPGEQRADDRRDVSAGAASPVRPPDRSSPRISLTLPAASPQCRRHRRWQINFPYGQCTYYVATRRAVSWGGNAANGGGRRAAAVPKDTCPSRARSSSSTSDGSATSRTSTT